MDEKQIKVVAMDLDGTLSQHKQFLPKSNKAALRALKERYRLLMVGAGAAMRIYRQMEGFPVDIVGNYGMQYAEYDEEAKEPVVRRDSSVPCDRERTERLVTAFREKYGFTQFKGDNVEYHASGCITFPLLGTKAELADKLAFDPDRSKRRKIYGEVVKAFFGYNVFVGGSSSFDMAPKPYNKFYALDMYCREKGLDHKNVVYLGDDYGLGGNDESVYLSDFHFLPVDDYRDFPSIASVLL